MYVYTLQVHGTLVCVGQSINDPLAAHSTACHPLTLFFCLFGVVAEALTRAPRLARARFVVMMK